MKRIKRIEAVAASLRAYPAILYILSSFPSCQTVFFSNAAAILYAALGEDFSCRSSGVAHLRNPRPNTRPTPVPR